MIRPKAKDIKDACLSNLRQFFNEEISREELMKRTLAIEQQIAAAAAPNDLLNGIPEGKEAYVDQN